MSKPILPVYGTFEDQGTFTRTKRNHPKFENVYMNAPKFKVLFLCTGNSCRSQMAEGWTRHLHGDAIEAYSAGTATHGLNADAVLVMSEAGVDISRHESKSVMDLPDVDFDLVVTVCDNAREACPVFPRSVRIEHHSFDDPPRLAETAGSRKEELDIYRRVRDEIRDFVNSLPAILNRKP